MNNEDYCSYELSKALKAAGFDEPCNSYYIEKGSIAVTEDSECFNRNKDLPIYSRPTLYQAQKWLRSKGIDIEPHMELVGAKRKYRLVLLPLGHEVSYGKLHPSYEEALEAGIEAALIIIEIDNKKTTGDTRNENRFN